MFTIKSSPEATLDRIRHEYYSMASGSYSLRELFSPPGFNFDTFCKGFSEHRLRELLCESAKQFCEQHGILLKHASNYIDCALFLYPTSPRFRITNLINNLAVDYYLNDAMGRDVFGTLPLKEQQQAAGVISRIVNLDPSLSDFPLSDGVERANIQVMRYFKNTSTESWYNSFYRLYVKHIQTAHKDNNVGTKGYVPSVTQYIDDRCDMSGMHHVVSLIEYADGAFLEWDLLRKQGLENELKDLQYVTAVLGGILNDFFSFEKEVIRNRADSNLLAVVALNASEMPLAEVIVSSANIVRDYLERYLRGMENMRKKVIRLYLVDQILANTLSTHLDGLERCVQASWLWQMVTSRYKSENSIWRETQLKPTLSEELVKG